MYKIIQSTFRNFNSYNKANEIRINDITEIEHQTEDDLRGELKEVCESIEYAVQNDSVKAVAGVCTIITKFEQCTKYRLADSSGIILIIIK